MSRVQLLVIMLSGGKDSLWSAFLVRWAWLLLKREGRFLPELLFVTEFKGVTPPHVVTNLHRLIDVLHLDDHRVVWMEEPPGEPIRAFGYTRTYSVPEELRRSSQQRLLFLGHQCHGLMRLFSCFLCNRSMLAAMIAAFSLALERTSHPWMATGDRPGEASDYTRGVNAALASLGLSVGDDGSLSALFGSFGDLSEQFGRRFGVAAPRLDTLPSATLGFLPLGAFTSFAPGDHAAAYDLAGFEWNVGGSETDCLQSDLGLVCTGFLAQWLGLSFEAGFDACLNVMLGIMSEKDFPEFARAQFQARVSGRDVVRLCRGEGLSPEAVRAMTWSPVAGQGRNLRRYLSLVQEPALGSPDEARRTLSGEGRAAGVLEAWQTHTMLSGSALRRLWRQPLIDLDTLGMNEISTLENSIFINDPYPRVVVIDGVRLPIAVR